MAQNPFAINPLGGFNVGQAISNVYDAYQQGQQRRAQEEQIQAQQQQQQAFQQDLQAAFGGDEEAVSRVFSQSPEIGLRLEQREQQNRQRFGDEMARRLNEKNFEYAKAYKFASDEERPNIIRQAILDQESDLFDKDDIGRSPQELLFDSNLAMRSRLGEEGFRQLGLQPEQQKSESKTANRQDWETYQQLKKTNPEEATQFGQKVGFVSKEGRELTPYLQKQLTKYGELADEAGIRKAEFDTMAADFERLDPTAGIKGGVYEYLKEITGSTDAVSELRRKYAKIRASELVKNLPPGAASEKDVELALSGFPSTTSNAETMASFLRGLSKLQSYDSEYNEFRSKYLSDNATERGMREAWIEKRKELQPSISTQDLSDEELLRKYGG